MGFIFYKVLLKKYVLKRGQIFMKHPVSVCNMPPIRSREGLPESGWDTYNTVEEQDWQCIFHASECEGLPMPFCRPPESMGSTI